MYNANEQLKEYLKTNGYSATSPRLAVFRTLQNKEPMTMSEVIKNTRGVDRASVYRTIGLFEDLNVVRRLNMGWKYKLELNDPFTQHHHHLTCTNCGKIVDLGEDKTLETYIRMAAAKARFKPQDHELEIRGLCADCRK